MVAENPPSYIQHLNDDFLFFVEEVWKELGLHDKAPLGDVERDIINWIATGPIKRGVLAWRGIGKTHFGTAAYTLWRLYKDPETKILIVSKSTGEAKKTIKLIRQWIRSVWFLQQLDPKRGKDQIDSASEFNVGPARVERNCSVTAVGIEGQLPSKRAHVIIADDVETPNNTKTIDARQQLQDDVTEFRAIASFGEKEIIYIGTFHHEESLYLALAKKNYVFYSWPKVYPTSDEKVHNLAPMLQDRLDRGVNRPGDITCPHRITIDDIVEDKAEGPTYWAMQCMLIADLGDALRYPLQLSDFIVVDQVHRDKAPISVAWGKFHDGASTERQDIRSLGFLRDRFYRPPMIDKDWVAYRGTKMRIDPAGRGQDKIGYAIIGQLNGYLWVKAVGGLEGGPTPENITRLAELAYEHRAGECTIESNFGGDSFAALLEPELSRLTKPRDHEDCPSGWGCSINLEHSTGQKELRILAALEAPLASHRIVIGADTAANEDLQYQITRLTRQRDCLEHEDELEALAMCVKDWREELSQDTQRSAQKDREAIIDKAIEKLRKARGLKGKPEPRWIDHRINP